MCGTLPDHNARRRAMRRWTKEEEVRVVQWLESALRYGGLFVKAFAETMFCADDENYKLLLPMLLQLMKKYPQYSEERMKAQ